MRINWHPPKLDNIPLAEHAYRKDYAAKVHDGEPELDRPARPWMETTIYEYSFAKAMAEEMKGAPFTRENLIAAWKAVNEQLGYELDFAMEDERWGWPRTTRRRNGTIAGMVRDIVDTGELRDSRELNFKR